MEVSSEISLKIRSAIKAKLLELGAYVDDELPDYIMVMVANKRSRVQMKNDLGLFLGVNTDPFTWWLNNLLSKLQTIKSDSDNQGNTEIIGVVKDAKKVGKLQKSGGKVVKRKITKLKPDSEGVKVTSSDIKLWETESAHPVNSVNGTENGEVANNDVCLGKQDCVKDQICQNSKNVRQFPQESGHGLVADVLQTTKSDEIGNVKTVATVGVAKTVLKNVDATTCNVTIGSNSSTARQISNSSGIFRPSAVVRKRRASTSVLDHVVPRAEGELYEPCNEHVDAVTSFSKFAARKFNKTSIFSIQANRQADSNVSEDTVFDSHGERQEPPQKVLRMSEAMRLEDIKQALAEVIEKTQGFSDDVTHFSKMVESSLRKLHPRDFSLAKLRIQQILFEFESIEVPENIVENTHQMLEQATYSNQNSKYEMRTYFRAMEAASDLDSSSSLNISASAERRKTFSSPHTPPGSPPSHDANQNSDDQAGNSAASDQQVDNVAENHVGGKFDCATSDQRTHFESQINRIIFHPKSAKESLKSSRKFNKYSTTDCESKALNRLMVKSKEKEGASGKIPQLDNLLQSPISLTKADMESTSSAHSSPQSNTSGLNIRRHVTSASRESTVSPHDLQSKPGSSHKFKSSSAKNKPLPPILVDSIHNRKRQESVECSSVLRQNCQRDKSPRAMDNAKSDTPDSPKHYGPEALKVMAKNLKITVINKRAVKPHESSSDESDDDDEDEDIDSSDNEDDEEDEEKTKVKEAQNKALSGQPSS